MAEKAEALTKQSKQDLVEINKLRDQLKQSGKSVYSPLPMTSACGLLLLGCDDAFRSGTAPVR